MSNETVSTIVEVDRTFDSGDKIKDKNGKTFVLIECPIGPNFWITKKFTFPVYPYYPSPRPLPYPYEPDVVYTCHMCTS